MMKNLTFGLMLLSLGLFSACGNSIASVDNSSSPEAWAAESENYPQALMELPKYKYDEAEMAKKLSEFQRRKSGEHIPLVTVSEQGKYFFVVFERAFQPEGELYFTSETPKLGLYNEAGKLILPIEYEALGNLNTVAKDWIEVKKDGRWGLFNPLTEQLTALEYDVLYPYPFDAKVLAQVRKGNQFGWLDASGKANFEPSSHSDKRLFASPVKTGLAKQWVFSAMAEHILPFVETESSSLYHIFTPQHWVELGLVSPHISDQIMMRPVKDEVRIKEVKKVGGLMAVIAELEEHSGMVRSYHVNIDAVTVLDEKAKHLTSQQFPSGQHIHHICKGKEYLRFIAENIIELKRISSIQEGSKENPFDRYGEMTLFKYYEITGQGDIRPLDSDRIFDGTKYVKMDETYFEGCQASLNPRHTDFSDMYLLQEYLTIDDLDLMRNEIFAEYGLRFKTDKWRSYFSAQSWYQGRYDNVDDKLTDIDKHNIQLILKMKAQMERDPNRYQKKKVAEKPMVG